MNFATIANPRKRNALIDTGPVIFGDWLKVVLILKERYMLRVMSWLAAPQLCCGHLASVYFERHVDKIVEQYSKEPSFAF